MASLDTFEKHCNDNLVARYLTDWLKELLEMEHYSYYEVQLKEELWDRINALRTNKG